MIETVFLGTPAEAVPTLRALERIARVALVVTAPDRPAGRSRRPRSAPVKGAAEELGLTVAQPERVGEIAEHLAELAPEVGVLVAYGQILPPRVLEAPRAGILNVHFSLLPRWRGAAPVHRAILAGEEEAGVSLMRMEEGLDTGPVLARRRTPIRADDTTGSLTERLADLGAEMVAAELSRYLEGELEAEPQDEAEASYAPKVSPEEAHLDPSLPAERLWRQVRAFCPRPGAWGWVEGERFKVWAARPAGPTDLPIGRIELRERRLLLGTGEGALELLEVQPAGRGRMEGEAWARGRRGEPARLT